MASSNARLRSTGRAAPTARPFSLVGRQPMLRGVSGSHVCQQPPCPLLAKCLLQPGPHSAPSSLNAKQGVTRLGLQADAAPTGRRRGLKREKDKLGKRSYANFLHHCGAMVLDRAPTDTKVESDFLAGSFLR